jgi:hypothetical protein
MQDFTFSHYKRSTWELKVIPIYLALNIKWSWVLVAHACNPNYSEGRDQKNPGSRPVWANSLLDPVSKVLTTKKDLAE